MLAANIIDINIAAGEASRPYDYDFSRVYSGVLSIENAGWQSRGWMYDPNLTLVYGSSLSGTTVPTDMKVGVALSAVALLAVAAIGLTTVLKHRR